MVGVKVGSKAPDFVACNPDGFEKITLNDIKGKTAVISFFPAAFSGRFFLSSFFSFLLSDDSSDLLRPSHTDSLLL